MKYKIYTIIFLLLIAFSVKADNSVSLEIINECDIQYAGESCLMDLGFSNTTGNPLEGVFVFGITEFDGIGIDVSLNGVTSIWDNGSIEFQDFKIEEGQSIHKLLLKTHSALVSGEYSFTITVIGGNKEEIIIPSVILTSMGGVTRKIEIPKEEIKEQIEELIEEIIEEQPKVEIGGKAPLKEVKITVETEGGTSTVVVEGVEEELGVSKTRLLLIVLLVMLLIFLLELIIYSYLNKE